MKNKHEISVRDNYFNILDKIDSKLITCGRKKEEVSLVAVTKQQNVSSIQELYEMGCCNFAENRMQEALPKIELFKNKCCWHFIGTLQSNKVNKAIEHFALIHSVDSLSLAHAISSASSKNTQIMSILLQVNTSQESSKHGLSAKEWEKNLSALNELENVQVEGLMTMAPFTRDETVIRKCFKELYDLREKWQKQLKFPALFRHLSMGMSNDYLIAIEEGATLLRIGSLLFQ